MSNYCSWVPTVGGRLSFSIIGDPQHSSDTETVNIADDVYRYLICRQQRDLLDSAFPFLKKQLASLFFSYSGTFEFFLIAKVDNDASIKDADLKGVMCFYPVKSKGWSNSKTPIEESIEAFYAFATGGNSDKKLSEIYNDQLDKIVPIIKKYSFFHVEFNLSRSGIVKIMPPNTKEENSLVPDEFIVDGKERRFASAQLFFFLKDISHVHQHHHAGNDTIVDLHADDPEQTWRHKIIRSLYRRVLHFKRSPSEKSCLSSLGVLSYLRSFIEILKKEDGSDDEKKLDHLYLNDDNIDKSINIALAKCKSKQNRKLQFRNNLRSVVLSVFALVISIVGLAGIFDLKLADSNETESLRYAVTFLINNLMLVFVGIIAGGYVWLLIENNYWREWGWVTDFGRIMNTFNRRDGGVVLIVLSLLGAYLLVSWLL